MDSATLNSLLDGLRDLQNDKDNAASRLSEKKEEIETAEYDLENMFDELESAISTLDGLDIDAMMTAVDEAERLID